MAGSPNSLASKTYDAKTGKVVDLAPEQVRPAFDAGAVGFKKGSTVQMHFADGTVRDVPASDVSGLLSQGVADLATKDQAHQQHLQSKFGKEGSLKSLANKAMVFQDAIQKGFTLGASDAAKVGVASLLGKGKEEREYIRESREYSPTAAIGGEIAGATLGALAPGFGAARGATTAGKLAATGAGLIEGAEAARALVPATEATGFLAQALKLAPAALQESAGLRLETALASKIPQAENIFQRVVAEGTKLASRGAAEGAIQGVADQLNEDLLGDVNVRADKLFASGLHGALFGAAIGGALGGGKGLLGKPSSKLATEATTEGLTKLEGEAVGEGLKVDRGAISSFMSKLFGFEPVKKMGGTYEHLAKIAAADSSTFIARGGAHRADDAAYAMRYVMQHADEIIDDGVRKTRDSLQEMHRTIGAVMEEAKGDLKKSHVEKFIRKGAEDELATHAADTFTGMQKQVSDLLADSTKTEAFKGSLRNLNKTLATLAGPLAEAISKKDAAAMYMGLDAAKRALGSVKSAIGDASVGVGNALAREQQKPLAELLEHSYAAIKTNLEDENMWGQIGRAQADINNAWHGQIAHGRDFRRKFVAQLGQDPENAWAKEQFIKPEAIDSYVRNLTNPKNDLAHMTVREYVSRTKLLAEAVDKSLDLSPARKAEVQKAIAAAEKAQKTIESLEGIVTDANQKQKLMTSEKGSGLLEMGAGMLSSAALGGLPGLGVAAAFGGAVRAITRPVHTMMMLAALEEVDRKVSKQIAKAAKGIIRGGEIPKMQIKFRAAGQDIRRAYEQAIDATGKLEQSHDKFADEARKIPSVAPNTAGAYVLGLSRAAQYLSQEKPVPLQNTYLRADENARVSDIEMAKFVRKYETVKDPMSALRDFEQGRITLEQVHALKATAPEAYKELCSKAVEEIAKEPLNYDAKLRAAVLLDQPTDWSLSPEGIRTLQASAAGGQAQSQGQPAPPKRGGSKAVAAVASATGLPLDKLGQSGVGRRR